jgi:predicted metal-dependent hydrolase
VATEIAVVPETLSDAFVRGAFLFDSGAFFEAHEIWEDRWRVEPDPTLRLCLQGLIQVAAAFHKLLVVGAEDSALRLLARGLAKLDACPATVRDLELGRFHDGLRTCAHALATGSFDRAAIPKIGARDAR